MASINVDFEVFKKITALRETESMTENDVIRKVLGLPPSTTVKTASNKVGQLAWVCKGVTFPHGTEFRASYKGRQYLGIVENGALVVNGKKFLSPSSAAETITQSPINGWKFWECLLPDTSMWQVISSLREA